ncbi:MAG: VCBS domain-containing protein, partial [Thiotrichales bacterium]|nr:VCBS domain-containing protein [Thiotrichales bacterium]
VAVASTTGGNFENLVTTDTATVTVSDTIDVTTVTLSVSDVNVVDGLVTFTATLSNPGETGKGNVTITTEHGDIVIAEGGLTGNIVVSIGSSSEVSATVNKVVGGNFEAVDFSGANASVPVGTVTESMDASGMPNFNAGTPISSGTLSGSSFSTSSTSDYGTFTVDPTTGKWTFELDNTLDTTNKLADGEVKNEVFKVTVDGKTEFVIVKVNGANDSPNAENASFSSATNTVEFNLADYTSDVEDDRDGEIGDTIPGSGDDWVTRVEITSLPEFGDLYDGTTKLAIGSIVEDPTTIRYEVDSTKLEMPSFDADSYLDAGFSNSNKTASFTVDGVTVSGGTFTGDSPNASSTITPVGLSYVSGSDKRGLGVGSGEIESGSKEFISISFASVVTGASVTLASVLGNYQETNTADAQVNVMLLKDGVVVSQFDFNDTYNGSGIFTTPLFDEDGFNEIRVFTEADRNSNITLQSFEATNLLVDDEFNYNAVDVEGATEPATVTLNAVLNGQEKLEMFADEDREVFELLDVNNVGQLTYITNYDVADDVLDLSDLMDSTVTKNNLDQYLKLGFVDSDGDGNPDATLITIDSNGDAAGGDLSYVYIQDAVEGTWKIGADDDTRGQFDLDD